MSALGRLVSLGGMVMRYLGMLGSVRMVASFMRICGLPMPFGRFFVVLSCFVVVVLRHFVSVC